MVKGNECERKRQLLEGLNKTTRHSEKLGLVFWMVNCMFMSSSLADEWFEADNDVYVNIKMLHSRRNVLSFF